MMALDEDQSGKLYAASAISALMGVSFAGARIYSNLGLLHRKRPEDWIIGLSSVGLVSPKFYPHRSSRLNASLRT